MAVYRDASEAHVVDLARANKLERLTMMKERNADGPTPEARLCAAIEIQRAYRGYTSRCKLLQRIESLIDATDGQVEHYLRQVTSKKSIVQKLLELRYKKYVTKQTQAGNIDIDDFKKFCNNYIGEWWVGKHDKILYDINQGCASTPATPAVNVTRTVRSAMNEEDAATVIQRAWRKHIDMQVFRYYRDLISFKRRGDPAMMLRCINPKEAKILDAAIGVHIKFRLAGEHFPPNIYYKIFTHRPIQDLCANSPKDYTHPDVKRKMIRDVNNKTNTILPAPSKSGWYQRHENNGWRLVSDRLIHHIMSDPITWETSNKRVAFNHSKYQRRADVEMKKKQKKIDWMKKMYKQGMLQAKVTDPETVELIEGAAAGMVATIDNHGPDAVHEWEVDELLDWTTSLNFDDYWLGWKEAATSATSEKPTEDRFRLTTSQHDPFELTVSNAGQQPGASTRQSHNTPASGHSITSF